MQRGLGPGHAQRNRVSFHVIVRASLFSESSIIPLSSCSQYTCLVSINMHYVLLLCGLNSIVYSI